MTNLLNQVKMKDSTGGLVNIVDDEDELGTSGDPVDILCDWNNLLVNAYELKERFRAANGTDGVKFAHEVSNLDAITGETINNSYFTPHLGGLQHRATGALQAKNDMDTYIKQYIREDAIESGAVDANILTDEEAWAIWEEKGEDEKINFWWSAVAQPDLITIEPREGPEGRGGTNAGVKECTGGSCVHRHYANEVTPSIAIYPRSSYVCNTDSPYNEGCRPALIPPGSKYDNDNIAAGSPYTARHQSLCQTSSVPTTPIKCDVRYANGNSGYPICPCK